MFKKIGARVEIKHTTIKHNSDLIIKLRAELENGKHSHESCTHNVKSTLIEVDSTKKKSPNL